MSASHRAVFRRFSLAQAAPSFVGGFYIPFFPLWLAHQGVTPFGISTAVALSMFVRVLTGPAAGMIADAIGDRRAVAMALAAVAAAGFTVMGLVAPIWGFAAILPLMMIATPLNSATGPIVEAVTARGAIEHGFDYARARLWGSIAFVVSNYAGGLLVGATGPGFVIWMVAVSVAANVVAFSTLPPLRDERRGGARRPFAKALRRTTRESRVLLKQPVFLLFLACVSLAQASHVVFYTFGAMSFRALGYSDSYIGALWAIGTVAEVILFAAPSLAMRRAPATTLIALGAGLGVVRWIGMAFDSGPIGALVLQLFHAATFGLVHLGTMKFLGLAVPARLAATGQSLFAVVAYGLVMGLVTLAAGWLYERVGQPSYLAMAVLSAGALLLSVQLKRVWSGRNLFAIKTSGGRR